MEKVESKSKLPSTSDGIKTQEEANRLVEEETAMRKEVEVFLLEELDKLLAEKTPIPESKELPRRTSQELSSSEKLRAQPKKLKFGVEKTGVEEDLLTLLDEPWDIPKDPTRGEVEDLWDNLSLLDESMQELKPLARRGGPSRLEEEDNILEEEEEEEEKKKKEGGRLLEGKEEHLVKISSKEGQHLMKPVALDYLEEEDNLKDGSKHNLCSMRTSIGTVFEHQLQHLQNLKGTMQKKNISMLPLGYFSKFSNRLTSKGAAEQGEQSSEESEPWNWIPRFLKRSKQKRIASFRRKPLKSQLERDQVTDLSKIFSEDFFKSQDRAASEDIPEEDLSPSPEDIPQQSEEESKRIQEETKKQEADSLVYANGMSFSRRVIQADGESQTIANWLASCTQNNAPGNCQALLSWKRRAALHSRKPPQVDQNGDWIKPVNDVPGSSLWPTGQRTSPWQMGHAREFSESIFKDKAYKQKIGKHERDSKVAVPLPLQELMEEEVLAILKATLVAYQRKLGMNHPLTEQMQQQVDRLHLQLQGRGII